MVPEAALTLLIPLGLAELNFIVPWSISIHCAADHCVPVLSCTCPIADGRGLPIGWRLVHSGAPAFGCLLAASALLIDYALGAAVNGVAILPCRRWDETEVERKALAFGEQARERKCLDIRIIVKLIATAL